ncbi:MAG: hypothetical protein OEX04_02805 [Acidimicrobiia bacterium]|nr:hypothetical protein [Acidimicrobiia bacterium]MDH4306383.1 hypothetical protein [Acidimicrobiia bacterium]MDH5292143.1 hypothetical protein [Acidimicrobiia bacterium]
MINDPNDGLGMTCSWLDTNTPGWIELVGRLHGPTERLARVASVRHPVGAGAADMARVLAPFMKEDQQREGIR